MSQQIFLRFIGRQKSYFLIKLPSNGAILISGATSIIYNYITAIAQRRKIIKLNHFYLYDKQTDHIKAVF